MVVPLLLLLDAAVAAHLFLPDRFGMFVALFHAASGWIHLLSVPLVLLAAVRGQRAWLGLPSLAFLGWTLARSPGAVEGPADLVVVTHNTLVWNDDPARQAERWLTESADILVVQELSPAFHRRMSEPDLLARFPHRRAEPSELPIGLGIYSRIPLDAVDYALGDPWLRAELDGIVLYGVHARSPYNLERSQVRSEQLARLGALVAAEDDPVLVLGDLNAGPTSPAVRRLRTLADLSDTVSSCGHGWTATWSRPGLPPVLRLDHVLVRDLHCVDVAVLPRTHSDHAPVRARLRR